MKLPVLMMLASMAFAVNTAAEDLQSTLMAIEKESWQGWADHDPGPVRRYSMPDVTQILVGQRLGGLDANAEFAAQHGCTVKGFELSESAIRQLTPDVVILTYTAHQDGACDGVPMIPEVWVAVTYVRRDSSWKTAHYQETPVK